MDLELDTPLTDSGAGRAVSESSFLSGPDAGARLREGLTRYKFLVLRGIGKAPEDAMRVLRLLGELVQHEKREEGVLNLDGSKDEAEVLRGQEYMPLHKDGLLMGIQVAYVGIFCARFRGVANGRTLLCDAQSAIAQLPDGLLDTLERRGIEARAVDTDYYLEGGASWYPLPAVVRRASGPSLNLGLPYAEGARPSWLVRVAGVDSEVSTRALAALEDVLMSERFLYRHEWAEGDLLLFDNHRMLHGREAYTGDRVLANLQVREE